MHLIDDKPELWPYLLASLAVHALFIALIPASITSPKFEEKPIEVFAIEELPETGESYRIADIAEPAVQKRPKSAKFLGLYDSTAKEETVGTTRPGKAGDPVARLKKSIGASKRQASKTNQKEKSHLAGNRDRLLAFNKDIFNEGQEAPDGEESGSRSSPGGGGSLDDFYPDLRRGQHTYLNVLRYPDVEYFVRLKRAFKIAFNPEPTLRDYFFRNQVARGSVDVVLGVALNRSGELSELFVFRGSGIPGYDQEALRTVRASAPFSTPPPKFLSDDGFLRMTWTFSVYF